jgi:AcrR family transcriptional regulator
MEQVKERRRRLTGEARRARIDTAAVQVFAERGYDATSVGEIAAAAGVSRTVLYDHYPSKRALYLHVLDTQNAEMLAAVGSGIRGSGAGHHRMKATIEGYLEWSRSHSDARRLLVDPIPPGDPELDRVIRDLHRARADAVTEMLGPDLMRAGIPPGSPVSVVVELLISGIEGVARWMSQHPDVALDRAADVTLRLLWNGLPRFADD